MFLKIQILTAKFIYNIVVIYTQYRHRTGYKEITVREIVAVVNQKGGSGKTTTAHALGIGLKKKGYKVLFIDLDGQANLTMAIQADQGKGSMLDVLTKKMGINEAIQNLVTGDILAGNEDLFKADIVITETNREYAMKEAINELGNEYDYIVIDTPPALCILTINALVASSSVIIVSQAEKYNLNGVDRVYKIIDSIQKHRNKDLVIRGVLLTMFRERVRLNRDFVRLMHEIVRKFNTKIFKTTIRDSIVVNEAQAKNMPILNYAPKSKVAKDYEMFVEEFLGDQQ